MHILEEIEFLRDPTLARFLVAPGALLARERAARLLEAGGPPLLDA